ncbi:MAG: ABC transporter permease subunit [Propionibacteriaceae bacterium]|nr:ABC transporter permease subunit [Propionibacteriaceae bacterium]
MTWLRLNWPQVLQLVGDHLALSLPAILLSILIAVPIGYLAVRLRWLGKPLLLTATLLYAIPALPLLIIIAAVFGFSLRSPETMIAALTIYGVALLVRTAADGFDAVDGFVRDSAIALGHSPLVIFFKVDLPLAVPVLISGIRVVAVSTVSLVTIGALIGVSGLGFFLTDGFQRGILGEVVTGLLASVALAGLLDALVFAGGRAMTPWVRVVDSQPKLGVAK